MLFLVFWIRMILIYDGAPHIQMHFKHTFVYIYIFNRICFFLSMYIYWHRILYRCNQVCSQYCNIDRMELKRKYFQRNRYFLSFRMHTWTSVFFFLHMLVSVSRQMFRHGLCIQFENNLLKINNPCFEFSVILHTTQPFEKYSYGWN